MSGLVSGWCRAGVGRCRGSLTGEISGPCRAVSEVSGCRGVGVSGVSGVSGCPGVGVSGCQAHLGPISHDGEALHVHVL